MVTFCPQKKEQVGPTLHGWPGEEKETFYFFAVNPVHTESEPHTKP